MYVKENDKITEMMSYAWVKLILGSLLQCECLMNRAGQAFTIFFPFTRKFNIRAYILSARNWSLNFRTKVQRVYQIYKTGTLSWPGNIICKVSHCFCFSFVPLNCSSTKVYFNYTVGLKPAWTLDNKNLQREITDKTNLRVTVLI